jgi:hypothetical protein
LRPWPGQITGESGLFKELSEQLSDVFGFIDSFNVFHKYGPDGENGDAGFLGFRDRYFRAHPDGPPYILGANQVNEGTLYFLFIAVLCLHPAAPNLLAIDNADLGLNPLVAKRLMTIACQWLLDPKRSRQVLMTTHNPLVLDGLPLDNDRVRLFTVDRDNDGRTVVKRFRPTDEHRAKASDGWPLSRMWVNGLIGGVPDV